MAARGSQRPFPAARRQNRVLIWIDGHIPSRVIEFFLTDWMQENASAMYRTKLPEIPDPGSYPLEWTSLDTRAAGGSSTVNLGLPETLAAIRMGR